MYLCCNLLFCVEPSLLHFLHVICRLPLFLYYQEKINVLVEPEVHDIFSRIPGFGLFKLSIVKIPGRGSELEF